MSDRSVVIAAYAVMALCWAGTWVVGKYVVGVVPPLEMSAVRFAIVAVILVAVCVVVREPLWGPGTGVAALAGIFGITAYNALVFVGLRTAPASDGALIVPPLIPIFTAVGAIAIGERLSRDKVAGLAVASLGTVVVIGAAQPPGSEVSVERLVADLLVLGGAACWAAYAIAGRIATRTRSPLGTVTSSVVVGAIGLAPLGMLEHGYRDIPTWPPSAWFAIAYLVVLGTIVSFVVFQWAVRRHGAGVASMSSYMVPVAAVTLAFVFLGERPHPAQLVGAAVILAGVRIATLRRRPAEVVEAAA